MLYSIVALIAWRPEYRSMDEPFYAKGFKEKFGGENNLVSHDCYNFLRSGHSPNARYYGYFPTKWDDNNDCNVNLNLSRIDENCDQDADFAQCPVVYFVARNPGVDERDPQRGRLHLVGWYEDAKVYAQPQIYPISYPRTGSETGVQVDELTYRTSTRTAVLLPEDSRPMLLETRDFGFANNIWIPNFIYLDESDHLAGNRIELRKHLESIKTQCPIYNRNDPNEVTVLETRRLRAHRDLERRSNYRLYRSHLGNQCDACGFKPDDMESRSTEEAGIDFRKIWDRSLEIHHLIPFSQLDRDEVREIILKDLSLLCARCHRAIHATEDPSDIKGFRKNFFDD